MLRTWPEGIGSAWLPDLKGGQITSPGREDDVSPETQTTHADRNEAEAAQANKALDALVNPDHPTKRKVADWAEAHLRDPELAERDQQCRFWEHGWGRLADEGVLGLLVDRAYGGSGRDVFDALLTFEGLGYGCSDLGLIFAASSTVWTMLPMIERFGSEPQKERYLPDLVAGTKKVAFCMTESGSGSDSFALSTTYTTETVDGAARYVLSGKKSYVTLGPVADVYLVFATSDPALGQWGITVFLVDRDTPGLTVGDNRPKMGLRTTPFGDVQFEGCILGPEQVVAKPGAGAAVFSHAMLSERAFILSPQVGAMERALDDAVGYAQQRRQFDQPIAEFQAVSHRLADMRLRYDNARLQMYRAAILEFQGRPAMDAAALAKIQISEASIASALDAMRTHGATGYLTEFGVEANLRDVAGGVIYGGTNDVQRNLVASLLGRRPRS